MPKVIRNPYIAGTAIGDAKALFGRNDVLQLVDTVLRESQNNVIVLFGQRRIGKTSILFNLQQRLTRPPFFTVYFDLMGRASDTMGQVVFELASKIAAELNIAPPMPSDFLETGAGFRENFLPRAYEALGENRLIVLTDEFDVLDARSEEGLSEFSAHKRLLRYLYDLITNEPRLGFVFVVGRKAEDLSINYSQLFKAARSQVISVLPREATIALIRQGEAAGTLHFDEGAVERIYALTTGHPYFTQLLCSLVFERVHAQSNIDASVTVSSADIDVIAPQTFEAGQQIFEWIWDGLAPAERLIFSAVAGGTDEHSVISKESVIHTLASNGIDMVSEQFELAPRKLVDWEMLRETQGGYRFFIELMRRWVAQNKPLSLVRDEIDRVNPMANRRYEIGSMLRQSGQLEEAVAELRIALNLNANHFKARRALAATYKDLNKLDDAVREWSEVFRRNPGSREHLYGYTGVLLTRGEDFERQGRADEALADYEQVLEIIPNDAKAYERKNAIWQTRGQSALAKGELEEAIEAFERGEAVDLADDVRAQQRRIVLRKQAESIPALEKAEQWDAALTAYEKLTTLDPHDEKWSQGLARVKQEQALVHNYAAARAAMTELDLDTAQRLLIGIINVRPGYKETIALLGQVVKAREQEDQHIEEQRTIKVASQAEQALQRGDLETALSLFESEHYFFRAEEVRRMLRDNETNTREQKQDLPALKNDTFGEILTSLAPEAKMIKTPNIVSSMAFSPDGKTIASGSANKVLILWDVSDQAIPNVIGMLHTAHTSSVLSVAFSPDGKTMASGGADNTIILWDMSDRSAPKAIEAPLTAHTSLVRSLVYSPDGKTLASGSADRTIILWDVRNRAAPKMIGLPLTAHTSDVFSVAFSPDGKALASGSWDNSVILWDVSDRAAPKVHSAPLKAHISTVSSVVFSPDGKTLASASWDKTVILWDVSDWATPKVIGMPLKAHIGSVSSVAFSPDGKVLASASWDNSVILWDVSLRVAPKTIGTPLTAHTDHVGSLIFSPDGKTLASGSKDKTVILWDVSKLRK